MRTVLPPAITLPRWICSATAAKSSGLGLESASTKISQSPVAAAAPVLRARAIWLMGSNTTLAPAARANCAVASLELLSQTTISEVHPSRVKTRDAA